MKARYIDAVPFEARDGSEIRELMHPARHGNANQSLAEALVKPGQSTRLHCHDHTEEIYYITSGVGRMTLGNLEFDVSTGDTVCIPPGTAHCVRNSGDELLRILCCCSPPYSDADTRLL